MMPNYTNPGISTAVDRISNTYPSEITFARSLLPCWKHCIRTLSVDRALRAVAIFETLEAIAASDAPAVATVA